MANLGVGAMSRYRARSTNNVMPVGMNYLSELVLRPGIEKKFWPLLQYRGNMNIGHAHRLWNMSLLMMAAEAETLSDGLKIVNNAAFSQLCGPVRKPGRMTLFNFFGRLSSEPHVTDNIQGLTEYVKSLQLGPCRLEEVELETARANCAPWRISTHENPGQEPGERGAPQLFYPYAVHDSDKPDEGRDLLLLINKAVPTGLPEDIRADVCQELIVSVLTGEITKGQIKERVQKQIGKVFGQIGWKWEGGMVKSSFDAPLQSDDPGFTLADVVSDGTYNHWADTTEDDNGASA